RNTPRQGRNQSPPRRQNVGRERPREPIVRYPPDSPASAGQRPSRTAISLSGGRRDILSRDAQGQQRPLTCHECGEVGHFQRNCPKLGVSQKATTALVQYAIQHLQLQDPSLHYDETNYPDQQYEDQEPENQSELWEGQEYDDQGYQQYVEPVEQYESEVDDQTLSPPH
ncbi:MAG: hypothetical protein GY737_02135, partial [Desulfobacteraceae bacterium]|nr:hypothetical protein [Desulfobacteraceae bacterium]